MKMMVALDRNERAALVNLAKQERRDPRDQAAVLIRRELERLGLLPPTTPAPAGADPARPPTGDQEVQND